MSYGILPSSIVTLIIPCRQVNISQRGNAENNAGVGAGAGGINEETEGGGLPVSAMLRRHAKTPTIGRSPSLLSTAQAPDAKSITTLPRDTARRIDTRGGGDLCLGMAVGISASQLVTFVASFRETSPLADLVLFFEAPASARFREIIEKCVLRCFTARSHSSIWYISGTSMMVLNWWHRCPDQYSNINVTIRSRRMYFYNSSCYRVREEHRSSARNCSLVLGDVMSGVDAPQSIIRQNIANITW